MIKFTQKGDFKNIEKFLSRAKGRKFYQRLDSYGRQGVDALSKATPVDTGVTAGSWDYRIEISKTSISIVWTNSNQNQGIPIVVLIQYGHGTRNGGYVQPNDFINPTMKPLFEEIADSIWTEVTAK